MPQVSCGSWLPPRLRVTAWGISCLGGKNPKKLPLAAAARATYTTHRPYIFSFRVAPVFQSESFHANINFGTTPTGNIYPQYWYHYR
jgi:hypothetical protein